MPCTTQQDMTRCSLSLLQITAQHARSATQISRVTETDVLVVCFQCGEVSVQLVLSILPALQLLLQACELGLKGGLP